MNKVPCIYAIVRFRPFVETGEFANVGIVVMAPEHRFFDYKLLVNRHARVTHFFEQLDGKVYKATMRHLQDELARAKSLLMRAGFDRRFKSSDPNFAKTVLREITRPRETVIQFSEQRAVLAPTPAEKLEELFNFYVERSFVTREYQEATMERGLRRWLYQDKLGDLFAPMPVGDDLYHVNFPFVEGAALDRAPKRAMKPLNLAQDQPSKILDHGGQWIFRLEQLRRRKRLPQEILFAISAPPEVNSPRHDAFAQIADSLAAQPEVTLAPFEREPILEFARRAVLPNHYGRS